MRAESIVGIRCNVTATKTNMRTGEKETYKNHNMILNEIGDRFFTHGCPLVHPLVLATCTLGTDNTPPQATDTDILGTQLASQGIGSGRVVLEEDTWVRLEGVENRTRFPGSVFAVNSVGSTLHGWAGFTENVHFVSAQRNSTQRPILVYANTWEPVDFLWGTYKDGVFGLSPAGDGGYLADEDGDLIYFPIEGGEFDYANTVTTVGIVANMALHTVPQVSPCGTYIAIANTSQEVKIIKKDASDPNDITFSVIATLGGTGTSEQHVIPLWSPTGAYLSVGNLVTTTSLVANRVYERDGDTFTVYHTFNNPEGGNGGGTAGVWSSDETRYLYLDRTEIVKVIDFTSATMEVIETFPTAGAINTPRFYLPAGDFFFDSYDLGITTPGGINTGQVGIYYAVVGGYEDGHLLVEVGTGQGFYGFWSSRLYEGVLCLHTYGSMSLAQLKSVSLTPETQKTKCRFIFPAGVGTGSVGEALVKSSTDEPLIGTNGEATARVVFDPVIPKGEDDQLDVDWEIKGGIALSTGIIEGGQRTGGGNINYTLYYPQSSAWGHLYGLGTMTGLNTTTRFSPLARWFGVVTSGTGTRYITASEHDSIVSSPTPVGLVHSPGTDFEVEEAPGMGNIEEYVPGSWEREFRVGLDTIQANGDIGTLCFYEDAGWVRPLFNILFTPPLDKVDTFQLYLDTKIKLERV